MTTKTMLKITKTEATFPSFRWLLTALYKGSTRPALNSVLVEDDPDNSDNLIFVCTDGRRLHTLTAPKIAFVSPPEPGLYDVLVNKTGEIVLATSDCDFQFPNWRQVIPTTSPEDKDQVSGKVEYKAPNVVSSFTARCNCPDNGGTEEGRDGQGSVAFDDKLLADLLGVGTLINARVLISWEYWTKYKEPLNVRAEEYKSGFTLHRRGVLMPMRPF